MNVAARVVMTNATQTEFMVLRGPKALARCAADWLLNRVLAVGEMPAVCLSGGSTPTLLYQALREEPYRDQFPWQRVHWFWGDERFVAPTDPRSNYGMARAVLFDHVPVPRANIHPIDTHGTLSEAAALYERELRQFAGSAGRASDHPLFAATLLGLGTDGHTASLFPGDAALNEQERWVATVPESRPIPRITLTLPALASSGEIGFLVSGATKRAIFAQVRRGADMPATRVLSAGRVRWFVDRAAAGQGPA
jgi:6-phosphogluconolactonase